MSFLTGSQSSTKWAVHDLPMSPRIQKSKRRHPIPFLSPASEIPLPLPATQRTPPQNIVRFQSVASKWASIKSHVKRTIAAPYVPSSASLVESVVADMISEAPNEPSIEQFDKSDEVDEVVVDRRWSDFDTETTDAAETASSRHDGTAPDVGTLDDSPEGVWALPPLAFTRRRVWPVLAQFYMPRFEDKTEERLYQKECWGQGKRLSLWSSVFFIANCLLAILTIQSPVVLSDKIFFFGIAPVLSVPILFMCAYDFPYNHPYFFQTFLCLSTWSWPVYEIVYAFLCGFYSSNHIHRPFTCGSKDFLSTFYYTSALQAVALFGTSLKRLPATIGALAFLILSCVTIIPMKPDYARNVINFVIFECVLLYMHSQKEQSSRKLFWLRTQLKVQFQRTRKAQVNERQAADSKRRLTSYVFHEVRVPLNTALLAVQNMASRPIAKDHEVEFSALEGSLSMMSKVLNDVLDFNRMDSGQLESLSRPYAFHKVLRSLFIPLQLAADARRLQFVTDLDMRIDEVARRAAYQYMEASPEAITQHLLDQPSGESVMGMVVGDETRLRQIITNLASNACKFTPAGGKLTITTRLVIPVPPSPSPPPSPRPPTVRSELRAGSLTATALDLHNESNPPDAPSFSKSPGPVERIVVRIEVSDTGSGIPPKDMVESKLFSAFNQTEQGRTQGGKGTGLGLALVRQIVKLSGGRLGLRSKVGVGSTFWVELPLGVGGKAMVPTEPATPQSNGPEINAGHTVSASLQGSGSSVTEAVDAAAIVASQSLPTSTRSTSALHGLMDQGGRFELMLKYDSHSPVPTRTLGDASTGTEYPLSSPEPESESGDDLPVPVPVPSPLQMPADSVDTVRPRAGAGVRPTYVPLPSPPFTLSTQTPAPSPPLNATPSAGLRVLVVDDDAMTRMLMTRMLERMGCRVVTAENGEVALQRIVGLHSPASSSASAEQPGIEVVSAEPRFAVIFLDNQMPKLSGVKLVERLRQLGRTDFVVGVTGNALLTDQKEYLDAGADHVLTKPVLEASLKSMLALADARKKASQGGAVS
ncbi:histidine kinase [Mycena maculata]|uniref:histidine kinase n=1 Tax=Mycena maculata TaxID=230809 RepID=A0AAD7KCP0_9AGAR|nr:histidine kinase [Mycena maculata]